MDPSEDQPALSPADSEFNLVPIRAAFCVVSFNIRSLLVLGIGDFFLQDFPVLFSSIFYFSTVIQRPDYKVQCSKHLGSCKTDHLNIPSTHSGNCFSMAPVIHCVRHAQGKTS